MWDRYDPRSDDGRDRGGTWDRDRGGRGGSSERDCNGERNPRDVFTRDLDLPRGRERRPVRERDRVCEINGSESRMLGTIGAFRVVSESDRLLLWCFLALRFVFGLIPSSRRILRTASRDRLIPSRSTSICVK